VAEQKTCPNCGNLVSELLRIDPDMRMRLHQEVGTDTTAEAVCPGCYSSFGQQIARGSAQRSRREAKEQHRLALWRSRVQLVREARDRFAAKDYSGSVIAYEKYLRVLEIIYELKVNELKPDLFDNSARQKELVVIASAYWDLMRVYDQSKSHTKRLKECAEKLAAFLPHTATYKEISKKIEEYAAGPAKNKDVFYAVLRKARKKSRRCFIATAAFESPDADPVIRLALFRDQILMTHWPGRIFIKLYYLVSPAIAAILDRFEMLRRPIRLILRRFAMYLSRKFNLNS